MPNRISSVLNEVLREPAAAHTATELAGVAGVSQSMISKVCSGEAELSMGKVAALSRYLCEHGDTRLAECFLTPEFVVSRRPPTRTTGRVRDHVAYIVLELGQVQQAHTERDKRGYSRHIENLTHLVETLRAEGKHL